jgi:hypothetical protein
MRSKERLLNAPEPALGFSRGARFRPKGDEDINRLTEQLRSPITPSENLVQPPPNQWLSDTADVLRPRFEPPSMLCFQPNMDLHMQTYLRPSAFRQTPGGGESRIAARVLSTSDPSHLKSMTYTRQAAEVPPGPDAEVSGECCRRRLPEIAKKTEKRTRRRTTQPQSIT